MGRIWVLGVAVTASLGMTGAAVAATKTTATAKTVKMSCRNVLSEQIPAGATDVVPGAETGIQAGTVICHKLFGAGVQVDPYTLTASGNLAGSFQEYFNTGTLHGTYMLAVTSQSAPTGSSFTAAGYTGKMTIAGGTGAYVGVTGKGSMTCSSPDAVHMRCTAKLTVKVPAGA